MARFDKKEIFEQSKAIAKERKLLFVQDIIDYLPLSKATFYNYFPLDSDELDTLTKILDENKVAIKSSLRAKWYNSDNATLQMALYKLTSNEEEHRKLNQYYQKAEVTGKDGKDLIPQLDLSKLSDKELLDYHRLLSKAKNSKE